MRSRNGQGDQPATGAKHLERTAPHRFAHAIEYDIVAAKLVFDSVLGIVDHLVSAERPEKITIPRARRGSDMSAKAFSNLQSKDADASSSGVDQNFAPGLDSPFSHKRLPGSDCGERNGRGFFMAERCRFNGEHVFRQDGIFSIGPAVGFANLTVFKAVYFIAGLEERY